MSIETNLNSSPYFDDYDQTKDFYKVLFKPGVALQARELTQLQTILQKQIERFGDNIYKSGTVISGLNFEFIERYDYAKILDTEVTGVPVDMLGYNGYFVKNSANLIAKIVNVKQGLQSRDPETNYIFLKYINAGDNQSTFSFSNNDVLTVYNNNYQLFGHTVNNGGSAFVNADAVIITSAIVVQSSNVAAGANVVQVVGATSSNLYVKEVNTTFGSVTLDGTTYSNTAGYTILKLRPNDADLANSAQATTAYSINAGYSIVQGSNTANVLATIGSGATALLTTDSSGVISSVTSVNGGSGYSILPDVRVRSASGVLTNVGIAPKNFKSQITIAGDLFNTNSTKPVGNGYAFSVTEGVVYQKGAFLRVPAQTIVVNAYSSAPDGVTIGLEAVESIVNSNIDDTLLDVAQGTPNYSAPGADRLKIVPTLVVANTADVAGNSSVLTLVEFREGEPFKQFKTTAYNSIATEFENRTYETSGNFVIDPFLVTTKDQTTWSNSHINVVVDPGLAYIEGKRINTNRNTFIPLPRSTNTRLLTDQVISINYGNYVLVNQVAGYFDTKTGSEVTLYDTPRTFITLNDGNISNTTFGSAIGTGRIRSLVLDSGIAGTAEAVYRAYLFELRMVPGKSFKDARSIYQGGTNKGVMDTVLSIDPSTGLYRPLLQDKNINSLIFPFGNKAIKAANNIGYIYRTSDTNRQISIDGTISVSTGDTISYGNNTILSSIQRRDIIVTPTESRTSSNTLTGGTINNGSNTVSVVAAVTKFAVGDFVRITSAANSAANITSQIVQLSNANNFLIANSWSHTSAADLTVARHLPAYVPIPLTDSRSSANVSSDGKTLTISISNTTGDFTASDVTDAIVTYNARKVNAQESHRPVKRGIKVKISVANNVGGNSGPWCLGLPDAIRLNAVYAGTSSSVSESDTEVTKYFFINNGQNNDYYGHSHLTKAANFINNYAIPNNAWLLVDFDVLSLDSPTAAGFFTIESFDIAANGASRAVLGNTAINLIELPEYQASNGEIIDLRDYIDFRPRVVATANTTATTALATTNPANTINLGTHDKLFPVSDSEFETDYEYYLRRTDRLVVDIDNNIRVVEGTPSTMKTSPPPEPPNNLTLAIIDVPPYPTYPAVPSTSEIDLGVKKCGTEGSIHSRYTRFLVTQDSGEQGGTLQPKRYTMSDIGRIERRLEDVEYYTHLSILENKTKDLTIPSEADPTRNRFKNGFFVETFADYTLGDLSTGQFTAEIDQTDEILQPPASTINLTGRFNYSDATTRANIISETPGIEPGQGSWGEALLTLPVAGQFTMINQQSFTSAVTGDGSAVRFVGDMTIKPTKFKVTARTEVRLTGDDAGPMPTTANAGGGGGGGGGFPWWIIVIPFLPLPKIICTKLHEMGYLDEEIYAADQAFGKLLALKDPMAYKGYRAWADTVVEWMSGEGPDFMLWIKDKSRRAEAQKQFVTKVTRKIATPWAYHMAYKMGYYKEDNMTGKVLMKLGIPFCRMVGYLSEKTSINIDSKVKGALLLTVFGTINLLFRSKV